MRPVEAEQDTALGLAGGEGDAAARLRRAGHDVGDFGVDAGDAQRLHDLLAFPVEIGGLFQMLDRAAAAGCEVTAGRRNALRRGGEDGDEVCAVFDSGGRHRLARQRIADEDRSGFGLGDAVAQRAEARDLEGRAHWSLTPASKNSRLPSPPATGDWADAKSAPAG